MKLYLKKDIIGEFLSNWRVKRVLPFIRGRLLDFACGDNSLVKRYGSGKGLDITPYENVDLVIEEFSSIPLPKSSADCITILASINLFKQLPDTLTECNRLLSTNGKIIITLPNPVPLKIWHLLRPIDWEIIDYYSDDKLNNMFKTAGFKLSYQEKFMFFMNNIFIYEKLEKQNSPKT
tara:strand:- start:56 stop:589 length:534 start_codon:yes stop_codon:yes gene_type:complete